MVDDLLDLCKELEPTLLVFDPYAFAAPLVAAVTGVHAVLHAIGPLMDLSVLDLVADAASPSWREFGIDVPPAAGVYAATTLTICPPSLAGVSPLAGSWLVFALYCRGFRVGTVLPKGCSAGGCVAVDVE
jgi:hypothetical protein